VFDQIDDRGKCRKFLPPPGAIAPQQQPLAYTIDVPGSNTPAEERAYGLLDHLGVLWKFKYGLICCVAIAMIAGYAAYQVLREGVSPGQAARKIIEEIAKVG